MHIRSIAAAALLGGMSWTLPALGADPGAAVDAFHAALRAGKADSALLLLAPDVQMFEQGYVETSRDHYAGPHIKADMLFAHDTSYTVTDRRVQWMGDSAACVLSQTSTRGQFQGQTIDLVGTETAVLRKAGDGWVITHLHTSAHPHGEGDKP